MKDSSHQWIWGAIAVVLCFFLGLLDWRTGYELNFFVFYFVPVSIAAWALDIAGAVVLSVVSAMLWFAADHLTGHTYSSNAFAVWNTMIRLVSFLAIGWSVARLMHLLRREKETITLLSQTLSQIKVLESFLPICAECKKIRNDEGMWQQLEVYISEHSNTQFSHGYCPDCAKKLLDSLGLPKKSKSQAS